MDFYQELDIIKNNFKNIKETMIRSYPDYKLRNDKTIFNRTKQNLSKLFSNLQTLEINIKSNIDSTYDYIKTNNRNVNINRNKYKAIHKILKNKISENNSGSTLKLDKYNENIEEYFKTYFYIFSIILMGGFLINQIKN
jgi:hypothetical protein